MRRNKILAKALALVGATLFAGLAAGCGSGGHTPGSTQTVSRGITGFGATKAAWNRTHRLWHGPPRFLGDAENVYNADPSLHLPAWRAPKAHYTVSFSRGRGPSRWTLSRTGVLRVLYYFYYFNPRPIAAAKADVLRTQFPPDTKVAWFAVKRKLFPGGSGSQCAAMIVTSKTIAKVLGPKYFEADGSVLVYFYSDDPEGHWDPKAVVSAGVGPGQEAGSGRRRAEEAKC
jgi:hypothetical protein